MSKVYKIRANEKLFNDWIKTSTIPHTKLGMLGASIVQNDMELSSEELNDWFEEVGESINETEIHFAEVINELRRLRQQTARYIKSINN